ncbi:MAG: hypothetical protein Q6373_003595 [Candidatus Sigynarchaeota archaeon]
MEPEKMLAAWKAEKQEVSTLFKEKTRLARDRKIYLHYKIHDQHLDALVKKYEATARTHFHRARAEFTAYFAGTRAPIVAFDVEEFHNEMSCILGVLVDKELHVEVFLDSLRRAPCPEETARMTREAGAWLRKLPGCPAVLTHGFNQTEREITGNLKNECVNTQLLLTPMLQKIKGPEFLGGKLQDFEELVRFERTGCPFLKHAKDLESAGIQKKEIAFLFPKQAKLSIWNMADGKPARTCKLCGKEQDVFLYCLEDAIVTILIFLRAMNDEAKEKKANHEESA